MNRENVSIIIAATMPLEKAGPGPGCSSATQPLIDAFQAAVPEMTPADARTLLAKFGLRAAHVLRPAATLSPGERTRAALALLQGRGVNLLVLDEPTNHLDLPAIEQLESALASYPGRCCWSPTTGGCWTPSRRPPAAGRRRADRRGLIRADGPRAG